MHTTIHQLNGRSYVLHWTKNMRLYKSQVHTTNLSVKNINATRTIGVSNSHWLNISYVKEIYFSTFKTCTQNSFLYIALGREL